MRVGRPHFPAKGQPMATIDQSEFFRYGAGDKSNVFVRVDKRVDLIMAAGATVSAQITIPAGAQRVTVAFETPGAFSGAPTNVNARAGTAAAGQDIVADTDVKAQGHVTAAIAAALDQTKLTGDATKGYSNTPLYLQLAANGGTNVGGTCYAYVGYAVPAEGN